MKLTSIELKQHYAGYGENAVPGIKCEVELMAPGSYSSIKLKLSPEQTKEVVALAVKHALSQLSFDPETIDVVGHPGTPRPKPEVLPDTVAEMPL